MSPKTGEGETLSGQPLHIQQDTKTIFCSIIFYTAAQAPPGASGLRFGGQELYKREAAIKRGSHGLFDGCTWRRYTGS